MPEHRCINCMNVIHMGYPCPACGYDAGKENFVSYSIRPESVLHGRYYIGRIIGQGGFGITYMGFDTVLEKRVAVKEYFQMNQAMRDNTTSNELRWSSYSPASQGNTGNAYEQFLKEARKMAKIDSIPEIVRVLDTFTENNTAYIVMEYVGGINLKEWLNGHGAMDFSSCIRMLMPLMKALDTLHKRGLVHRDISPDNIMIQEDGSLKLLDFGAAKDTSVNINGASSQMVVKEGFSPYEQYTTSVKTGPWTDVYSICATIYYCITGQCVPIATDRIDNDTLSFNCVRVTPLTNEQIAVMRDGLAVRGADRIQSMAMLIDRLQAAMASGRADSSKLRTMPVSDNYVNTGQTGIKRQNEPSSGLLKKKSVRIASAVAVAAVAVISVIVVNIINKSPDTGEAVVDSHEDTTHVKDNFDDMADDRLEEATMPPIYNFNEFDIDDNGTLVSYAGSNTSVIVPDGVVTIGKGAFDNIHDTLAEVRMPESVQVIKEYAFGNCPNLVLAAIPSGVEEVNIGTGAFDSCPNLVIYGYEGSGAQQYAVNAQISFKTLAQEGETQKAVLYYKDGEFVQYEGEIAYNAELQTDVFHGYGTLKWKDGKTYMGQFVNGLCEGEGHMSYGKNDKDKRKSYDGTWESGHCKHGKLKKTNGEEYTGDFNSNDKYDGKGKIKFKKKKDKLYTYDGEWKNGAAQGYGKGVFYDKNNEKVIYKGYWKDNKMHGKGTLIYSSGYKVTGKFKNGSMVG